MKNRYLKFCDYVAKACGAFAVLALLLSILVIVELVFERYFFQRAITWQTELVTMLLVASTFIGSAYVLSEKAHVSMEWIYDFLSKKSIIKLKIFTSFISLGFFLILFCIYYLLHIYVYAFHKQSHFCKFLEHEYYQESYMDKFPTS